MKEINGTILQCFEWYLDCKQNLWNDLSKKAEEFKNIGFTSVWLPPAYKAMGGANDVGYSVYDVYDLGEFDQKGSVKTKYGSKDEYLDCIKEFRKQGIETYADIVLNHKMGADKMQLIPASKVDWQNHNSEISNQEIVRVATKFTFPGRKKKYSDFEWNWTDFDGIDYDDKSGEHAIFKFKDKDWNSSVDEENGNFDYLMGADLDFNNEKVVAECTRWGEWYIDMTKVDGFRLDAIKHIPATFYRDWIKYLRQKTKRTLYTVGEYWTGDIEKIHRYISETEGEISLFDVPLHYNLYAASINPDYDISKIFDRTLVKENSLKAVTFVDNHDTQPGQALSSFIEDWFKQSAYALILLRNAGYPCVFYGDLYGIPNDNKSKVDKIEKIIEVRSKRAYGNQNDYFDDAHYIGWTREGSEEREESGVAVVISTSNDGEKRMYIGEKFAGKTFVDCLANCSEEIIIEENGCANFKVKGKSASIWILK